MKKEPRKRDPLWLWALVLFFTGFWGLVFGPMLLGEFFNFFPRISRAISEIGNIELALTGMMADAGIGNPGYLFDPAGVRGYVGVEDDREWGMREFERAQALYTNCFYALLRQGRAALEERDKELGIAYASVFQAEFVKKLGLNYMNELGDDPWGNPYQIWPGPWDAERLGPVPFRVYQVEERAARLPGQGLEPVADCFTVTEMPEGGKEAALPIGLPAPSGNKFFIWSLGEDEVSGQAIMGGPRDVGNYAKQKDWRRKGGGDDVNNWDNGASWSAFYN